MKTILSILIAGAAGIGFIGTAMAENSTATKDSIAADYKAAKDNCKPMSGYDKSVCLEQAKATRAHAEADWAAANNQTASAVTRANNAATNADYALAKAKCKNQSGADKTSCMDDAKSARTLALSNTAGNSNVAANAGASDTRCDNMTGSDRDNCLATSADGKSNVVADSYITTKVKADLIKEPNLKSMDIHVETVQGTVQLTGFVNNDADAARAADLARGVKGVKAVRNDIKVK